MNYYQHHIGDFDKTTRHLTRIERSIYRDLIELYYDAEQPLTLDRAALCRKILARSNEESTAVEQVLNEFFTETAIGWYHDRCESEIERYHNNSSQKAQAGKASAAKRAEKLQQALNEISTDVEQPLNDSSTNRQPSTINHEPVNPLPDKTARVTTKKPVFNKPEDVSELVWNDFLIVRKAKKSPITESSIVGIRREAKKVNISFEDALIICIERNWQSFKADWHDPVMAQKSGSEIFKGVI